MTFEFEAINRDISIYLDVEVEGVEPRLDDTYNDRTLDIRQESFSVDFVCSERNDKKTMSLEMGFCPSVAYRVNSDGTISIIIQSLAGEFTIDNIINSVFLQRAILSSEAKSLADAQLYADRKWQNSKEAQELIAQALLKEFSNTISPVAINTMQAIFGSESLQYMFIESEDDDTLKPHSVYIDYHRPEEPEPEPEDTNDQNIENSTPDETQNEAEEPEPAYPEVVCPDGVIKHYTLGISEVRADLTVDSFMRWKITGLDSDPDVPSSQETRIELPDDDQAYYLYIKATKEVVPPEDQGQESTGGATESGVGEEPPVGGVGTAEFIVSAEAKEWDADEDYYYFLYATIGRGGQDKDRAITYWNGFTEITPGRITAYRFVSPDGIQYLDFLTKGLLLGDETSHIMFDHVNRKFFLKGTITQSPAGDTFPTPCYRGPWIENTEGEEANQVAYYGDNFVYEGQSWLCIDTTAVDEEHAVDENPSEENTKWQLYTAKGEGSVTQFKSIVFKRTNTTPDTPSGGSYADPIPSGWSDGVPSGEAQLWMSTNVFVSDGTSSGWTTPRPATDTADIDFEYSAVETNPGNPDDNPTNWHNEASQSDIWIAVRKIKNGEPVIPSGSATKGWEINKIKGEKGESAIYADLDNEMDGIGLDENGKTVSQVVLTTNVSMWLGTTQQTLTAITLSGLPSDVSETHNLSTGLITITIPANTAIGTNVPVAIQVECALGTRELTFTIAGIKGGARGDDAIIYFLAPSQSAVKKDKNGNYSVESVSCQMIKRIGQGGFEPVEDGVLRYSIDGGAETDYESAISTSSFNETLTFFFYLDDVLVDKETIPMLVDGIDGLPGAQGKTGRTPRGINEWSASGIDGRYQGEITTDPDDVYLDIVRYNNVYYRCKESHTAGSSYRPDIDTVHWEPANDFSFVATDVLYAKGALIDNATIKKLQTASDGSQVIAKTENGKTTLTLIDDNGNSVLTANNTELSESGSYSSSGTIPQTTAISVSGFSDVQATLLSKTGVAKGAIISTPQMRFNISYGSGVEGRIDATLLAGGAFLASQSVGVTSGYFTFPAAMAPVPDGTVDLIIVIRFRGVLPSDSNVSITPNASYTVNFRAGGSANEFGTNGFQSVWSGEGIKITSGGAKVKIGGDEYAMLGSGALGTLTVPKKIIVCTAYPVPEEADTLYIKVS